MKPVLTMIAPGKRILDWLYTKRASGIDARDIHCEQYWQHKAGRLSWRYHQRHQGYSQQRDAAETTFGNAGD